MSIPQIIFYLLIIDSVGANLVSWFGVGDKWYKKNFSLVARFFPVTKGWATLYLILVLWIGYLTWM